MIKCIFFDIDGTLISFQTHLMPESTRIALDSLRKKGIKLLIATGRSPHSLMDIEQILDYQFDGYVMLNGQYCIVDGKVIRDICLERKSIEKALVYMQENSISCDFIEIDYAYANFINSRMRELRKLLGKTAPLSPVENTDRIQYNRTYQISPYITQEEEEEYFAHIPGCRGVRWNSMFIDIIPENGGKAVGMKAMLDYFNLTAEECMAFGDGGNDVEMLEFAGIGVAMGNATAMAKEAADYITEDVDKEGIYSALLHYGLL